MDQELRQFTLALRVAILSVAALIAAAVAVVAGRLTLGYPAVIGGEALGWGFVVGATVGGGLVCVAAYLATYL